MFAISKQPLFRVLLLAIAIAFLSPTLVHADTMPLTQSEIEEQIQSIPQWQQAGQTITRTFEFKNFVEAIAFVDRLVEPAEAAAHHPDLAISYNKVTVSLTSHDAGGLTEKDFALAQTISQIGQESDF